MKKIDKLWEERGVVFKDKKEAVMEQSFPDIINNYIHALQIHEIEQFIPKNTHSLCLDVGCGYGRIAEGIIKKRKNVFVHGIDIAPTFVKLFNKKLKKKGKAVVGSADKLPYKNDTFDVVWIVGALMYFEKYKEQMKVVNELVRVLKPNGKLILIEPNTVGNNIVKLWGGAPFIYRSILRKPKVETYGIQFRPNQIDGLIKKTGGEIVYKKGYPLFTILLLPCIVIGKIFPAILPTILHVTKLADEKFSYPNFSHHITYIVTKK